MPLPELRWCYHVTSTKRIGLYADAAVIGGAERSMLHVATAYRGAHELVICSPSDAVLDEAGRLCPDIARARVAHANSPVAAFRAHRAALRDLRLDLVQVTLCNPFAARVAMAAAWSLRLPVIAVEQLVLPSQRRRGAVVKRLLSRGLAGHVAVGSASADELRRFFGIPRRSVTVIHNGVPDRRVEPRRSALAARGPVIGSAARLEAQKSLHTLVDAVADVPHAQLVLLGDGTLREPLLAQAAERGIADRVCVTGWVDDPLPLIAGLDVFALPSRAESFPLSIVEAMLTGVPVVASDVGSICDAIVPGRTGLLVPPGEVAPLAAALRSLIDDQAFAEQLAGAARDLAREQLTDVVMAQRYAALWAEVLKGR